MEEDEGGGMGTMGRDLDLESRGKGDPGEREGTSKFVKAGVLLELHRGASLGEDIEDKTRDSPSEGDTKKGFRPGK
jgi:hypothetical protein